jgi:hypothetical protein
VNAGSDGLRRRFVAWLLAPELERLALANGWRHQ